VAVAAVCLAFGNFVLSYESFRQQGFANSLLRRLPLLGGWAEGFGAGDATVAALYGFVLTLVMNVALIGSAKKLERAIQLLLDLRQASRSTDPTVLERVPAYRDRTVHNFVVAAALVAASAAIVLWDVSQFNFNYVSTFDPSSDAADVVAWAPDLVQHVGAFVADLIRRARWGYVGCLVALALILEDALIRAGHSWLNFHTALDEVVAPPPPTPREEVDHQLLPGPEPVMPAYDTNAQFANTTATPSNDGSSIEARATSTADSEPVSPPAPVDPPPSAAPREEAVVDVYVAPGRVESFPLAEVQTDSRRFVRDGSGRAWFVRTYWEELTGGTSPQEGVGR
jgi:hypothetical protein